MGLSIYMEFLNTFKLWRCTQCSKLLDQSEFYRNTAAGFYSSCKKCFNKLNEPNRKKYTPKLILKNHLLRMLVIAYYSDGSMRCACCGESEVEFLAIDHINGNGNKHRKEIGHLTGVKFSRWLFEQGLPTGYRVLCHNCNSSHGYYGYCPHEGEYVK